jgi:nitroimidazol reductase NimA-like FMN-containing flavoprotein (pyridoxamine 5'-phosphate oxidase superfamily)
MPRYHLRRADRALTERDELLSVLRRGRTVTVAMCHDGEPYLVTLSYGYDEERNALYAHMATTGRKIDALAVDPRVCATVVVDGGYQHGECTHLYESVVLTGSMSLVTDPDEARHGMRVLLGHQEDDWGDIWERQALDREETWRRLRVARLDVEGITGKAGH